MQVPIFLSSDDISLNPKSHDFTTVFTPEIVLDYHQDHFIGLNKIEMSYSWLNVTEVYKNNTLKYSHNSGTTWTEIKFHDGNYTYNDLQNFINSEIKRNGHNSKDDPDIKFIFYPTILRISIILANSFQLDFREGQFYKLIGADNSKIITKSETCKIIPNITNSVDSILIHCNLLSDSLVFGLHSDVLELIKCQQFAIVISFFI